MGRALARPAPHSKSDLRSSTRSRAAQVFQYASTRRALWAIPARFYCEGVRRYGFHGLSHEYVSGRLRELAPGAANGRVIIAHLGSGASMCALADGRSVKAPWVLLRSMACRWE